MHIASCLSRGTAILILGVACLLVLAACTQNGEGPNGGERNVELGVNFFPWYGFEPGTGVSIGGLGSEHWNSAVINQTGIYDPVAVTPDLGFYASDAPDVIAEQVRLMRKAGITVIMVNWWGWGDDDLDGNVDNLGRQAIDRATKALFDHIEGFGGAIKAFIQSENWMIDPGLWDAGAPVFVGAPESQQIWDYVHDTYVAQYPNSYYSWQAKPLFVSGAPHVLSADSGNRFTYKKIWPVRFSETGIHQGQMDWSWVDPAAVPDGLDYKTEVISPDGMVAITNRRDQYWGWLQGLLAGTPERRDPFLLDGLGDENWRLLHDASAQVTLVMVQTWNDYHEQSQIEPSTNGSFGSEGLLDKTTFYWERFSQGDTYEKYHTASLWSTSKELRQYVGKLSPSDLGLSTESEVDAFLASLLQQAQSLIVEHIGKTFTPDVVPTGVKNAQIRLAANMYNFVQMNKRTPVMQVGEFNFQINDDDVFTDAIRKDLRLYRKSKSLAFSSVSPT